MLIGLAFINPVKRWVNYAAEPKENADIKVISFNTRTGILKRSEVGDYLKSQNADVILLQEDAGKGYEFAGYEKVSTLRGITILSRHKVISEKILEPEQEGLKTPAIQVDIEINGKKYRFIDVYLNPFKFGKEMVALNGNTDANEQKVKGIIKRLIPTFKKHQEQIELIKQVVENSPYPVIVAGDFNSVPNSYEYYQLSEGLEDAFVTAGKGSATSFHDYKFPIRIDYIFSSKSIHAVSYKVDRSVSLSDHYPIVAEFSADKK
ncbi:endonuclease/exonuclease/phosphatase family protein [Chryseobacterium sp. Tr-659]|uniref:endonuclease/exonuclease/phosphatase family protein n=1 Tax=Chryseobacterium sp. Tr-659 TaxID=2608340 RepID=UPI001423EA79|nr:endonuclease/exonuclease/phosphatase family protein [Chryseobacterium sp. Tr-659]NIF07764.1 endonuclease/exonuclease/phosphatase family protein [Chryseobacterium sp. Tr-659]